MRLGRSSQIVICTFTLLEAVLVSADSFTKTYWLDESCTENHQGVEDAIKTAIYIAGRAGKRLDDAGDNNTSRILQKIFQLQTTDPDDYEELDLLKDRFGRQTGLTQLTCPNDRAKSDVRIYCDQDTRWTPMPDIENDSNPNSQRDDDSKEYVDMVNLMRLGEGDIRNSCRSDHVMALTVKPGAILDRPSNEMPGRHMITLCNSALDNLPDIDTILELVDRAGSNQTAALDFFNALGLVTILHEFSHCSWAGDTIDDHENWSASSEVNGYRWDGVLSLKRLQTLENADSFAYFAMLCFLLDYQWKISDDDNEANRGVLVKDASLPLLRRPQDVYRAPQNEYEDEEQGLLGRSPLVLFARVLTHLGQIKDVFYSLRDFTFKG